MINHYIAGREFLEAKREGSFADTIALCLSLHGVVHCSPDCLLLAAPAEDDPRVLHIYFMHSHLPALRRVLMSLPFKRVRWRREWAHGDAYGTHERLIADFCRHHDFGTGLTKQDT